jgi:hypothetical protein
MESLYRPAKKRSPEFHFKTDGEFWIRGDSAPEDAYSVYMPAIEWTQDFLAQHDGKIYLHIRLNHHNDGGSKYLMQLIRTLETHARDIRNTRVYWYYEWWDDEILFLGESLRVMSRIPFFMSDMYLYCMDLASQDNRVCPQPNHWQHLWTLINSRGMKNRTDENRPRPPFAVWEWTAALRREKTKLFGRHLQYANALCNLWAVTGYLERMREEDWWHGGDVGIIELSGMEYLNGNMN